MGKDSSWCGRVADFFGVLNWNAFLMFFWGSFGVWFLEVFLGDIRGSFSHQNFVCFSWSFGLLLGSHFGSILGGNILTKNIRIQT